MTKAREAAVRQRILDAGIAVFERHGFASASMTAIAAGSRPAGCIRTSRARRSCSSQPSPRLSGKRSRHSRRRSARVRSPPGDRSGDRLCRAGSCRRYRRVPWRWSQLPTPCLGDSRRQPRASRDAARPARGGEPTRPCSRRGRDRPGLPPDLDADDWGSRSLPYWTGCSSSAPSRATRSPPTMPAARRAPSSTRSSARGRTRPRCDH